MVEQGLPLLLQGDTVMNAFAEALKNITADELDRLYKNALETNTNSDISLRYIGALAAEKARRFS